MFHWYGLIVGVAVAVGWSVAERIESRVNTILLPVLLIGLLGARLYHVIDLWEYYSQNPAQILVVWEGGLGIFGGIIGGALGWWLCTRSWSVETKMYTLKALIIALPLSQAIGRWGNLVNNELWGRGSAPLFLYESILDLFLFGWLWRNKNVSPRRVVGMYFLGYGVIRLVLEPLKVDPWWVGYAMATLFVLWGGYVVVRDRRSPRHGL
jgi:phosphatidylglycerol---prolipoprotein diacylglyceryl transferase